MRYRVICYDMIDCLVCTVTEYEPLDYIDVKAKWHFTIRDGDVHLDGAGDVLSYLAMLFAESTG
jgi:hypothetical protein